MATSEELNESVRRQVGKSLIDLDNSAVLELFELYYDLNLEPLRFHSGTNNIIRPIIWNGNEYLALAVEVEGFEANILGRMPRPKVTVVNSDSIISSILRDYSDFRNSKFVRIRVFLKYLDNENFDGNVNPYGTPDPLAYLSKEKYIFSQKIIENKQIVQFELITPFDLQTLTTAARAIYGRYCYWQYRGCGCNYTGDLINQENEKDFITQPENIKGKAGSYEELAKKYQWKINQIYQLGKVVCIFNIDFNGLKDPPYTWYVCIKEHKSSSITMPGKNSEFWQKDGCSKKIEECKKRFSGIFYKSKDGTYVSSNNGSETNNILPFGGFPGTDKFQYE